MSAIPHLKNRLRQALPQVTAAVLVGYFLFHAVQGDRGVNAWLTLKSELEKAEALQSQLAGQRGDLEKRVALLKPDHLDADLLEERARLLLNYGASDDYILLFKKTDPSN
ncbi:MAG: septum formation initiator family protein [Pseudomonadota bacterium]